MSVRITQEAVEVFNRSTNKIRVTQLNAEVFNRTPNQLRVSQICVEVFIKPLKNTTDSAARSKFSH
jgi:hypothetical protein